MGPGGCWIYTGHLNDRGYGRVNPGRRGGSDLAHVVVYVAWVGPIPQGLELDHLCQVHRCVRPDHMEPVTHAENMRRMWEQNQAAREAILTALNTYRERPYEEKHYGRRRLIRA